MNLLILFRVQSYSKKLKANKKFTFFSLRISAVKQVVFQRLTKLGEKAWEGVLSKPCLTKLPRYKFLFEKYSCYNKIMYIC